MDPSSSAPGPLETLRRFVNTLDVESGDETLSGPDELTAWLRAESLLGPRDKAGPADVRRAVALREALREAMAANHSGAPIPRGSVTALNDAAIRARLTVQF